MRRLKKGDTVYVLPEAQAISTYYSFVGDIMSVDYAHDSYDVLTTPYGLTQMYHSYHLVLATEMAKLLLGVVHVQSW